MEIDENRWKSVENAFLRWIPIGYIMGHFRFRTTYRPRGPGVTMEQSSAKLLEASDQIWMPAGAAARGDMWKAFRA